MKEEFIPRSAALSKTHDIHVKSKAGDVDYYHRCIDPSDIEAIPAADVRKVVRGEWIRHLDDRFGHKLNDCIECSCCRVWFSTEDMFRRSYCPNCGADMREES